MLNYSTSAAGSVKVEIQGPTGDAIPGYALEDAQEIVGDEIERLVAWKTSSDVSALAGKPVRLRSVRKSVKAPNPKLQTTWYLRHRSSRAANDVTR